MATVGTVSVLLDAKTSAFNSGLQKAAQRLGKLGEQLTKTKIVTRDANGKFEKASLTLRGKLEKALSGTAKESRNAKKEVQGLSGALTGAAGAAAAFASVSAGFGLARASANAQQAQAVFEGLGGSIDRARAAVGGMVDDATLVQKANLAETMNIGSDAFERLAKISVAAAAKTGQSVDYMFDSIITGTARQSKMILDNLGILVSVEDANKKYAKANGLVASSLTDVQKRAAFQAEVFAQGDKMVRQLTEAGVNLINPFDRASAVLKNVADDVGALLAPAFMMLLPVLDEVETFFGKVRDTVSRLEPGAKSLFQTISGVALATTAAIGVLGTMAAGVGALATAFAVASAAAFPLLLVIGKVLLFGGLLAALAGALRVAWEENIGGIVEKWQALKATASWVFKSIGEIALDLFNFFEEGFDLAIRFVLQSMALIPRLWIKVVSSVLEGFEDILSAGKAAAKALGMEGIAASIGKAQGSIAGVRATIQGMNGDIDDAIDTIAEFANPLKLLRTGATGTFKFLFGEGGKDFAAGAGEFLTETGNMIGRGWKLLLEDAGVDMDNLILPKPKVKQIAKEIEKGGKDGISKGMQKARDQFSALLEKFRGREAAARGGPFAAISAELVKGIAEQVKASELAAKAGRDSAEALDLSRRNTARQVAAQINGFQSLDEFSRAAEFARERMAAAGISAEMLDENLRFEPGDFSDVLSKRVGQALDAGLKASGLDLGDADRKVVVDKFSDALAGALTGQDIDLDAVFEGLGTLIAGSDLGGAGELLGDVFGLASETLEEAADPAVAANLELASSAIAAANALDEVAGKGEGLGNTLADVAPEGWTFDMSDASLDIPEEAWEFPAMELGELSDAGADLSQAAEGLGGLATAGKGGAGAIGSMAGLGAGKLGAVGGPVGLAAGALAGAILSKVVPMILEAFQKAATMIVQAAGAIPKALDAALAKFADLVGDSRLGEAFKAMQIPALGTAAALATIAAVLSVALLPVTILLGTYLALAAAQVAMMAAAFLFLSPILIPVGLALFGIATAAAFVVASLVSLASLAAMIFLTVWAAAHVLILAMSPLGMALISLGIVVGVYLIPVFVALAAVAALIGVAFASVAAGLGLFSLAMKTDSFERFQSAFSGSIDRVIKALEPFFENLMFVAGLFDALVSVALPLAAAFANNEQAGRVLFDVFKFLAIVLGQAIIGIGIFVSAMLFAVNLLAQSIAAVIDSFYNLPTAIANTFSEIMAGILSLLASVAENIPGMAGIAQALEDAAAEQLSNISGPVETGIGQALQNIGEAALALSPDLEAMGSALEALTDLTYEEAQARGEYLAAQQDANEELVNVPQGFKVAAARFRAIVAEDLGTGVVPGDQAGGEPGNNFLIENLTVLAENPGQLADTLVEAVNRRGLQFAGRVPFFNDGLNNGDSN